MPMAFGDRDQVMHEALQWAGNDNWVICFGRLFDDYSPKEDKPWLCWAYKGERRPTHIQNDTVRYVLPCGEVTKLS